QPVDKIDIKSLEKLISGDPVLFGQLLKLANSSYYSRGVQITGLRNAIMRIGLTETINSLSIYLFKNILPPFPQMDGFSDKEFWEEAWACAVANRRLGDPGLMVETLPGELYLAGLLQGIGKLILAVYNPKDFEQCISMTRSEGHSLREAELEVFGTIDALVACKILESWNLPGNICAAVGYWQSPESAKPEYREIAALTQFACYIVRLSGLVSVCEWMERSSEDRFFTDLSNVYILKDNSHPLVSTGKQYKIVQEIVSILEKRLVMTQQSGSEESD
ncbi:MAG: HDOD domain-containing protein, partial [Desulfamplus sp.]|nr:HDOD domain-containing protein [Desulfamplus sp.]